MLDLDAIEAALEKMTPGDLRVVPGLPNSNSARLFSGTILTAIVTNSDLPISEIESNAEGIALLRNNAREMAAEIRRLRQFVRDSVSTCYPCETCGHGRTTRECVWCERDRLRDYAQNVAKWEAELILSQEAGGGGTREFPQFTAVLYDRWLELQAQRNAALETDRGSRETRTGGTQ